MDVGADAYYTGARGRQFFPPNIWPDDPPGFRAAAVTYYRAMDQLVGFLMRLTALGLGVEETFFDDKVSRSIGTMRLNYYPRQVRPPLDGQLRARRAHGLRRVDDPQRRGRAGRPSGVDAAAAAGSTCARPRISSW